ASCRLRQPSALLHLRLPVTGVAAERPGGGELAELVTDHVRKDGGRARPRADHPLLAARVHRLDPAEQPAVDERSLLAGSAHRRSTYRLSLPRRRPRTISLSDSLCLRRVRLPSVGTPHGVTGCRPPLDLPSPPPCGWSTGFIAEPR